MFNDLSTLVSEQAEMLENVEMNFQKAENYLEKAEEELKDAKEYHSASRTVDIIRKCVSSLVSY